MPVRTALPELEGQGFHELLDRVYQSGEAHRGRYVPVRLSYGTDTAPEERILDFVYQPMCDASGRVNGIFAEGVDVTEFVLQAQVLRESEEKFRTFAQMAPHHMWTSPANGKIDWFNEQALDYSGLALEKLTGEGWATMVHPDDMGHTGSSWSASLGSGENFEVETRLRRADGVYRWHLVRALLARDSDSIALLPSVVVQDELRSGRLVEYGVVPDLYENFYAISVRRHFEPPLLKALLQQPEAAVLGAVVRKAA